MNYAQLREFDVTNGPGVRTTLFVSGCTHNCKGCFNKEQQNFNYGNDFSYEVEERMLKAASNEQVVGVSILGGEPMQQFKDEVFLNLLTQLDFLVGKPIWVWTGHLFEDLLKHPMKRRALDHIDVLIDGKYEESKRDLSLKYRGSSNQRVIDVRKSLEMDKVIELDV